jgi:hypothetical protein
MNGRDSLGLRLVVSFGRPALFLVFYCRSSLPQALATAPPIRRRGFKPRPPASHSYALHNLSRNTMPLRHGMHKAYTVLQAYSTLHVQAEGIIDLNFHQ